MIYISLLYKYKAIHDELGARSLLCGRRGTAGGLPFSSPPALCFLGAQKFSSVAVHLHTVAQYPHRLVAVARCVHADGVRSGPAGLAQARIDRASPGAGQPGHVHRLPVLAFRKGTIVHEKDRPPLATLADREALRIIHAHALQPFAGVHWIKLHFTLSSSGGGLGNLLITIVSRISVATFVHYSAHRSVGKGLRYWFIARFCFAPVFRRYAVWERMRISSSSPLLAEWSGSRFLCHKCAEQ